MSHVIAPPAGTSIPSGKAAGYAIGACAVLTMLAIMMHPQLSKHTMADALGEIGRLAPMLRIVHGTVIAFMVTLVYGFTIFALRRGLHRGAVVAGLVAYAAGAAALVLAALIDGFLIPMVGARYAGAPHDVMQIGASVLSLCGAAIQVLSKFGVVALSAAIVCWSCDLLRSPGALRLVGWLGVATALVPLAVLFLEGERLVVMTLTIIVVAQGVWYLAVASLLVRERV